MVERALLAGMPVFDALPEPTMHNPALHLLTDAPFFQGIEPLDLATIGRGGVGPAAERPWDRTEAGR
jgi:hypothetical protein